MMKITRRETKEINVNELNNIIAKHYSAYCCYTTQAVSGNTTVKVGAGRQLSITVELSYTEEVTPDADNNKDKADEDS